jgi:NAD(P)-dependent dehydrogenase (short-subunit alcohol dehydrogenase family)
VDQWWSGKHHHHGGNVQVVSAPDGWPLWTSRCDPAVEHDITCVRRHEVLPVLALAASDLPTLADLGYEGEASTVRIPTKKPAAGRLTDDQKTTNLIHAHLRSQADQLFDAAAQHLGPITGLVNNAGVSGPNGRLVDADAEGMRQALGVNVLGYLLCARRALRDMSRTGKGAIVNISSAAATIGSPGQYVHYAAAKAAVDAMTVGLSKEVAADGIRVNCVAPGTIWTDFHADPERPAKVAANIPMGRAGQPGEIAGAVSWLLSTDAAYTTGAVLRVAGGL